MSGISSSYRTTPLPSCPPFRDGRRLLGEPLLKRIQFIHHRVGNEYPSETSGSRLGIATWNCVETPWRARASAPRRA